MQTPIPTFSIDCILQEYPTIKGDCTIGTINVYNEKYELIKSVQADYNKFFINLEELNFKSIVIKNTGIGYTISNYSNIISKCCNALPCIERLEIKQPCTNTKSKCKCQQY